METCYILLCQLEVLQHFWVVFQLEQCVHGNLYGWEQCKLPPRPVIAFHNPVGEVEDHTEWMKQESVHFDRVYAPLHWGFCMFHGEIGRWIIWQQDKTEQLFLGVIILLPTKKCATNVKRASSRRCSETESVSKCNRKPTNHALTLYLLKLKPAICTNQSLFLKS